MTESKRRTELTEAAYRYVLQRGLAGASLRPVAEAIGSSTGVLRFLFGSKEGLVRALLERARAEELTLLQTLPAETELRAVALATWSWLADPAHAALLRLWVECYAVSLREDAGPWQDFARDTVRDWLKLLRDAQPAAVRRTAAARDQRTAVLGVLRGGMLDLLATADRARVDRAVRSALDHLTVRQRCPVSGDLRA